MNKILKSELYCGDKQDPGKARNVWKIAVNEEWRVRDFDPNSVLFGQFFAPKLVMRVLV